MSCQSYLQQKFEFGSNKTIKAMHSPFDEVCSEPSGTAGTAGTAVPAKGL